MALGHLSHGVGTAVGRNLGGEVFAASLLVLHAVPGGLRHAVPERLKQGVEGRYQ